MKYIIDGREFDDVNDAADYISEHADQEMFDQMLDECYPEIEICGCCYSPSVAFELVDPIAYRCAFSDYQSMIYDDAKYELERMDDGDNEYIQGFDVEAIDDEQDDGDDPAAA